MALNKVFIACLLGLSLTFLSAGQAIAQTLPTIEDFFPEVEFGDVDLSPDGTRVALIDKRNPGKDTVFILNLNDDSLSKPLPMNAEISFAVWLTNDRLLMAIEQKTDVMIAGGGRVKVDGKTKRKIEDVPYLRAIAINADGSDAVPLFKGANKNLQKNYNLARISSRLPKDPDHVLMEARDGLLSLFKVNIHTGKYKKVETGVRMTTGWKTDGVGNPVVRYDWSGSARFTHILVKESGGKKWKKILTVRNEDLKDVGMIASTKDDPSIWYVSARPEGYDKYSIFKYDLKDGSYSEPISTHPRVDQYRTILDTSGNLYSTIFFDERLEYDFVDETLDKHYKAVNGFFNNESNVVLYQASGRDRWLLKVDGPQDPGSIHHYNLKTYKVEPLVNTTSTLKPQQLGRVETINFPARDGETIPGYLTHPAGKASGAAAPLIVMPHGGPELRDYFGFDRMAQFLASRGYRVFQPNFRGSSGYGEKFSESGYGEWGGLMQDDITDGVKHLVSTGKAQSGNICIAGASFGGYSALYGAVKTPDLYKCAVSVNGVTDLNDMVLKDRIKYGGTSDIFEYIEKTIGRYKKDKDKLSRMSPLDRAADINIPVLILHGEEDDTVPVEQAQDMNEALKAAGKSVRYVEYPNVDHDLRGLSDADQQADHKTEREKDRDYAFKAVLAEMEAFFSKHLTR